MQRENRSCQCRPDLQQLCLTAVTVQAAKLPLSAGSRSGVGLASFGFAIARLPRTCARRDDRARTVMYRLGDCSELDMLLAMHRSSPPVPLRGLRGALQIASNACAYVFPSHARRSSHDGFLRLSTRVVLWMLKFSSTLDESKRKLLSLESIVISRGQHTDDGHRKSSVYRDAREMKYGTTCREVSALVDT